MTPHKEGIGRVVLGDEAGSCVVSTPEPERR